jgi:hypothetical protein
MEKNCRIKGVYTMHSIQLEEEERREVSREWQGVVRSRTPTSKR